MAGSKLDGTWNFVFQTEDGQREGSVTFKVEGEKVTGLLADAVEVQGTFSGDELSLEFPFYSEELGFKSDLKMKGTLKGEKITGTWEFDEYSGDFEATRAK